MVIERGGALAVQQRDPQTPLHGPDGRVLGHMSDFWTWAYAGNDPQAEPRILPGYLVELALNRTPSRRWNAPTKGAAARQQELIDSLAVEVRGASEVPSLARTGAANISFSLANRPDVDVWIFALLAHTDTQTLDPLNAGQWAFFVVPDVYLELAMPRARAISLTELASGPFGTPVGWEDVLPTVASSFDAPHARKRGTGRGAAAV